MKASILLIAIVGLASVFLFGGVLQPAARNILITNPTAMPLLNGAVAVVLTVENQGAPDVLLEVASPLGSARFEDAEGVLPIRTGTSSLALDAAYILLLPTELALENGELLPLTLTFAKAGSLLIKARFSPPLPGEIDGEMAMGHGDLRHVVASAPFPHIWVDAEEYNQGWFASITTENFTFSEELLDGEHVPGTGHGHIYVGGMKLGRIFSDSFTIGSLPEGNHVIRVTLNTNNHHSYVVDGTPLEAETVITVD